MIQRIVRGTQAQIRVSMYVDGELQDPLGSTTITILREDGTPLVVDQVVDNITPGVKGYTLSPTQTAGLDVLTAYWSADNLAGTDQMFTTTVEIVGGFYFTIAEAQAMPQMDQFSADQVVAARNLAEQAIEEECGAFVERYARETFSGDSARVFAPVGTGASWGSSNAGNVLIVRERITEILSVSYDGTTQTVTDYVIDRDGVYLPAGWPAGYGNIELKYTHGFKQVPALVKRAAMLLTRRYLVESPVDSRTTRVTQEGATIDFQVDPSLPFDIPEVNAIVQRYGNRPVRLT